MPLRAPTREHTELPQLKRLSRNELFSRLQLFPVIEPMADEAYKIRLDQDVRAGSDTGHGEPWHTSFHVSQFPGSTRACPRAAMYQMMDIPKFGMSRIASSTAAEGKAVEMDLLLSFAASGDLISPPPNLEREDDQLAVTDPESWLSGHPDGVLRIGNRPVPIEVKSKFQKDIDRMRAGLMGPQEDHVTQLKPYISFIRQHQDEIWPDLDLEPCTGGFLYYISRDRPTETAEFFVELDPRFFEDGIAKLKTWKASFEDAKIPETHPKAEKKKHPFGWRWTLLPCQWCDYKKHCCKPDWENGITNMAESKAIDYAKSIRPDYSYKEARQRVLTRWSQQAQP